MQILVDMLTYAIDNSPQATLILISGDREFAYALSTLRLRQYRVVLVAPSIVHVSLKAHASVLFDWNRDILRGSCEDPIDLTDDQGRAEQRHTPPCKTGSVPDSREVPPHTLSPILAKIKRQLPSNLSLNGGPTTSCKPEERGRFEEISTGRPTVADMSKQSAPTAIPQTTNTHLPARGSPSTAPPVVTFPKRPVLHSVFGTEPSSKPFSGTGEDHFTVRYGIVPPMVGHPASQTQTDNKCALGSMVHSRPAEFGSLGQDDYASVTGVFPNVVPREVATGNPTENTFIRALAPTAAKPTNDIGQSAVPKIPIISFASGESSSPRSMSLQATPVFTLTNPSPERHDITDGPTFLAAPNAARNRTVVEVTPGQVKLGCSSVADDQVDRSPMLDTEEQKSTTPTNARQRSLSTVAQSRNEVPAPPPPNLAAMNPVLAANPPMVSSPIPQSSPEAKFASAPLRGSGSLPRLPPEFVVLVEYLKKERTNGVERPLRSIVGIALQREQMLYQRAGVATFSQYAALAEAKGIVKIGGQDGHAWISLHPDLQAPPITSLPPQSCSHSAVNKILPPEFTLLVNILKEEQRKGIVRASRSTISTTLVQKDKLLYKRAGVTRFGEYTALAERVGIVRLGGREGGAWISLHPDWQD